MKINEIVNEGILDALKFVGKAAWQAAGGKVDKKNPTITRANLEYVRKYLGQELYKQFIGGLIVQGTLTRSGKLQNVSQGPDIVSMAADFLKQAYKVYIATPERVSSLNNTIDNLSRGVEFSDLRSFFEQTNSVYLEMLKDVEATTTANTLKIIDQLSKGINQTFSSYPDLKTLIKELLADLSSPSSYQVSYPFTNSDKFKNNPNAVAITNPTILTLYQKTVEAIYDLASNKQLTTELAANFKRSII